MKRFLVFMYICNYEYGHDQFKGSGNTKNEIENIIREKFNSDNAYNGSVCLYIIDTKTGKFILQDNDKEYILEKFNDKIYKYEIDETVMGNILSKVNEYIK